MTPTEALAHFADRLPTNIDRQSPQEAVDREAVAVLGRVLGDAERAALREVIRVDSLADLKEFVTDTGEAE